jgi:hypothetical protein
MVIPRGLVVLLVEQRLERRLLFWAALQHEQHAIHRQIRRRSALIELRACQGVCVAAQRRQRAFIDPSRNTRRCRSRLRSAGNRNTYERDRE